MPLAPRAVEPATDGQDRVADLFGGKPAALEADIQAPRIGGRGPVVGPGRGLLPGGAGENLAVDRLHRPAAADEVGGEPVEQFRMRRPPAADAEIVRRGDEAAAEVMLPDPVDHHSRREGMIGARQPLGQFEPAAAGERRRGGPPEHGDESARHRVARSLQIVRIIGLAAPLDPGVGRRSLRHRVGHRHRPLGEKPAQLGGERIAPRFEGGKGALQRRDLLVAAGRRHRCLERAVEGAMGGGRDEKIIDVERGAEAADMAVAVDEGVVDRAIPARRQRAGEGGRRSFREEEPSVRPLREIEDQLHLMPALGDDGSHGGRRLRIAREERRAIEKQLDRRRGAGPVTDRIPPCALRVAGTLARTDVKRDVEPAVFIGGNGGKRQAEAVVLDPAGEREAKPT